MPKRWVLWRCGSLGMCFLVKVSRSGFGRRRERSFSRWRRWRENLRRWLGCWVCDPRLSYDLLSLWFRFDYVTIVWLELMKLEGFYSKFCSNNRDDCMMLDSSIELLRKITVHIFS